jgi:sulfur-carrier protein
MIAIKYFGAIAEKTNCLEEIFSESEMALDHLLEKVEQKYQLSSLQFSVAINQKIVQDKAELILKNNDVVAFLPPFAGG